MKYYYQKRLKIKDDSMVEQLLSEIKGCLSEDMNEANKQVKRALNDKKSLE